MKRKSLWEDMSGIVRFFIFVAASVFIAFFVVLISVHGANKKQEVINRCVNEGNTPTVCEALVYGKTYL